MNALADSYFFWVAFIMALLTLYILPTLIAAIRGTENLGWIIVLNLLPTGVGWLAALIAAIWLPRKGDRDRRSDVADIAAQAPQHDTAGGAAGR